MSFLPFPPGGGGSGISLLPPRLRYGGAAGDAEARRSRGAAGAWRESGNDGWTFDDGAVRMEVQSGPAAPPVGPGTMCLAISATPLSDTRIDECVFAMELASARPPLFLDRTYRWRTLGGSATLNDFGSFVVRWDSTGGGPSELRGCRGSTPARISWGGGRTIVEVALDAAALHPRWQFTEAGKISTAAVPWTGARRVELSLSAASGSAGAPPVVARFPQGAEAGFTLTDHCDFDDEGLLRIFIKGDGRGEGWVGRGLRLTKGVFMLPSSPPPPHPVPTLEDQGYRRLVEELRADGSEIAPHALSETGRVSGADFRGALERFARSWAPATWIDHGKTIPYCYTMGGAESPEYRLLDALRENGIGVLWSYHDTPLHGSAGLNLLEPSRSQMLTMGYRLAAHAMHAEFLVALHYGRSLVTGSLRGGWGEVAAQAMSATRGLVAGVSGGGRFREEFARARKRVTESLRRVSGGMAKLQVEPYTHEELLAMGSVVYPERAVPLHQAAEPDMLLFSTMEAVHTRDMYSPSALDRLIRDRGLHVGHTYLMNRLPYIAGIFERTSSRLAESWRGFTGYLADAVQTGRVWNPTAGTLAAWMRDREFVSLIPLEGTEVRVENPLPRPVRGFTLLLPRATPAAGIRWDGGSPSGWRQWDDWLAVWGDLPSRSSIRVLWGGGE